MVYPLYYLKYWELEHLPGELKPKTKEEWEEYISTCGCANHRDLIEMVHLYNFGKKRDLRYGYAF